MSAQEAHETLYKGVKSQVDKWSDDELRKVYELAETDTQPTPRSLEIIQAIRSEMEQRAKRKLAK
jgi:hypothetical protein